MFGAHFHCKIVPELNLILLRATRTCTKVSSLDDRKTVPDNSNCKAICLCSAYLNRVRSQAGRKPVQCFPFTKSEEETRAAISKTKETARVKFQLEEECQFGDSFHLIGDDPILGSWNPSDAIPFSWSEGNTWTVTLELPAEKSIQYKFLIKKSTGEILWQPGPDRTLQTWETKNVISVSADWSDSKIQKINEEQPLSVSEEKPASAESSHIIVYRFDEKDSVDYHTIPVNTGGPLLSMNNEADIKQNISADSAKKSRSPDKIAQNIVATSRFNHIQVNVNKLSAEVGDDQNLVIYDEGPVLVPGLTVPMI